jgi:aspartate/methionine/tyrosine aminotransferase
MPAPLPAAVGGARRLSGLGAAPSTPRPLSPRRRPTLPPPPALPPSALERWFAAHEFTSRYVACASDVEPVTLAELLSLSDPASRAAYDAVSLGYIDPAGSPALRAEVAGRTGGDVGPDDVVIAAPQELAYLLTRALDLAPADRVVLQAPLYEGLTAVASAAGCVIDRWAPRVTEGGRRVAYDVDDLAPLLAAGPPPALVAVNFPHAPTGCTLSEADLRRLVGAATAAGARVLLVDEMYARLASPPLPSAAGLAPRASSTTSTTTAVVSLGGLSKWAGAPGLRAGWLASTHAPLLARVRALRDYTTVCPPSVTDALALAGVRAGDLLGARGRALVSAGDAALAAFCHAHASYFELVEAGGGGPAGSTRLVRLKTGERAASFCERAVADAGVMLLPATAYPACPPALADTVRVGVGRADVGAGLDALGAWVRGSPMRV